MWRSGRGLVTALLWAASAFVLATGAGCDRSPTSPSPTAVVAFGDSLTFGIGTSSGNSYVSRLSSRTGVAIVNAGRPGDTTASALSRVESSVLSRDPSIVIVLLGGNDLLQNVPVAQRIANITTIVERIRGDGAALILVEVGSGPLDPFEGALPALAERTSSRFVAGLLDGIFGVPGLMFDQIHPNDAGHAIMADRIEPALRAALAAAGL